MNTQVHVAPNCTYVIPLVLCTPRNVYLSDRQLLNLSAHHLSYNSSECCKSQEDGLQWETLNCTDRGFSHQLSPDCSLLFHLQEPSYNGCQIKGQPHITLCLCRVNVSSVLKGWLGFFEVFLGTF